NPRIQECFKFIGLNVEEATLAANFQERRIRTPLFAFRESQLFVLKNFAG
ncbi:7992_t:CDS:1, partial [Dentiscutata heterogama]